MRKQAKLKAAEKALQFAHVIAPRSATVLRKLGHVREGRKDWPGAEAAYNAGVELGGTTTPAFLARRADVLARQHRYAAAISDCTKHPDVVPPPRILPRLAQHLRTDGHADEAAALLQRAIAKRPTAKLLAALAATHDYMGNFGAALETQKRAARKAPNDNAVLNKLGEFQSRRALVPFDLAEESVVSIDDETAKEALADAVSRLEHVAQTSTSPWAGYRLGRALESHGLLSEALPAYDMAVERLDKVDEPWAHKARQSWAFRRDYVANRLSQQPSDDPRLNRTITFGPGNDDMANIAGFFEGKVTNIGLFLDGFLLDGLARTVEICADGRPILTASSAANPYVHPFHTRIVHDVLAEFPPTSTFTLNVDGVPLLTKGGADAVTVTIPNGTNRLSGLLDDGNSINKKGRWSAGSESIATPAAQLAAYDKARRFFSDELGITLFVSYGTLLGCYRDTGPIPGDDDFDASFVTKATNPADLKVEVSDVIKALLRGGFDARVAVDGRMFHLRVDDIVLDINPFWFFDGRAWAFTGHDLTRDDFVPTKSITVDGYEVYIPADPEAFFAENYGPDWRTPRSDFQYRRSSTARAVLKQAFLAPSEVRALQEYSQQLRSTASGAGAFHGYGDPADPRFEDS